MFTSQSSLALPLQSARPWTQLRPHVPYEQTDLLNMVPIGQATPQAPQLYGSEVRSAQLPMGTPAKSPPAQNVWLPEHMHWGVKYGLSPQNCPAGQAFPQAPQFSFESAEVSHPFVCALLSQSSVLDMHLTWPHLLLSHP